MHTRMDIVMYDISETDFLRITELIKFETARIENLLSRFIPGSPVSLINASKKSQVHIADTEVFNLLQRCRSFYEMTSGYFNIACYNAENTMYECNQDNHTIKLPFLPFSIDLGGIGKGYALDRIRCILDSHNITHALISFGESSILAKGHHPYGDSWKIGVTDPSGKNVLHEWKMKDCFLSTSRSQNGHIIDPKSGNRIESSTIVSVMGPNAAEAEVLSTAVLASANTIDTRQNFPDAEVVFLKKK